MSTRSTNRSFKKLISTNDIPAEEIYKTLCAQTVDLVFTAHPTQVRAGTCRAMQSGAVLGQCSSTCVLELPVVQLGLWSRAPLKPCWHLFWAGLQSTLAEGMPLACPSGGCAPATACHCDPPHCAPARAVANP